MSFFVHNACTVPIEKINKYNIMVINCILIEDWIEINTSAYGTYCQNYQRELFRINLARHKDMMRHVV